MLAVGDVEQAHTGRAAADDAQRIEAHADQLRLVGDEHQLMRLRRREAGDDRAVAADIVDIGDALAAAAGTRSEEHTSELQSLMRISYAVFCLNKKTTNATLTHASHMTQIQSNML